MDTTDVTCPDCGGDINVFSKEKRHRLTEKLARDDVIGKCRKCGKTVAENLGEYETVSEGTAKKIEDMIDDMTGR